MSNGDRRVAPDAFAPRAATALTRAWVPVESRRAARAAPARLVEEG